MNGVVLFSSAVAITWTPWAGLSLFLSSVYFLACMIADGFLGEWRANRDRLARFQAEEDAHRLARQFRRTMDLYEWERRQG
jgi:hypothetical protein